MLVRYLYWKKHSHAWTLVTRKLSNTETQSNELPKDCSPISRPRNIYSMGKNECSIDMELAHSLMGYAVGKTVKHGWLITRKQTDTEINFTKIYFPRKQLKKKYNFFTICSQIFGNKITKWNFTGNSQKAKAKLSFYNLLFFTKYKKHQRTRVSQPVVKEQA